MIVKPSRYIYIYMCVFFPSLVADGVAERSLCFAARLRDVPVFNTFKLSNADCILEVCQLSLNVELTQLKGFCGWSGLINSSICLVRVFNCKCQKDNQPCLQF